MALELPHLALETLARAEADRSRLTERPLLVVEASATPCVHAANRAARRAGARPGMALADALAILDTPELVEHDPQTQTTQIAMLAGVLLQFSDHVHPEPEARRILLEVGRSRRLFGGLAALRERVRETLKGLGFHPRIGVARSPTAARLLATLRNSAIPEDSEALRRTLSPVPLETLPLPAATREGLRAIGLRRLGDLLRLARPELARRHGPELLALLDRLLGRRTETLPRFDPPPELDLSLRLEHEIHATGALAFPLKRLLRQAEAHLRGLNRSLQGMTLELKHREAHARITATRMAPTRITLERGDPGIRAEDWLPLWQTRLEREVLPAPVIGLRLRATRLLDPPAQGASLLAETPGHPPSDAQLPAALARLSARLGEQAIVRLTASGIPRPEAAQGARHDLDAAATHPPPTPAQMICGTALWLQDPRPIPPPLQAHGLGRLEDGWWDRGQDVRRDYAVTRDRQGRRLWLYRCLRSGQWFRQGYWG
ncbi:MULTISPECIES: DNA polymerase Y family protein [unclassified Thioalkalivibrio]|uniref:Y-family DNA polymerase n=1 Tax=unclassified Thioalkalivibrio TaxID=2621013 RepID=UPI000360E9F4|nr:MULTISPECIES: DNA polymerase Y family protein [unclassified Thioalkalivibrio]